MIHTVMRWVAGTLILLALLGSFFLVIPIFRPIDLIKIELNSSTNSQSAQAAQLDTIVLHHLEQIAENKRIRQAFRQSTRNIHLSEFWLDRCEVPVKHFQSFLDFMAPAGAFSSSDKPPDSYSSNTINHRISGREDAPVSGVGLKDAAAYCKTVGGRLPSSEEWMVAASSGKGLLYPWGNDFNYAAWPYQNPLLNAAQPCGIHPEQASEQKIHNLASGVAEWVAEAHENPSSRLNGGQGRVHGGDGFNRPYPIRALSFFTESIPATTRSPLIGFRCAYDQKPQPLWVWQAQADAAFFKAGRYPIGPPRDVRLATLLGRSSTKAIRTLARSTQNATMGPQTIYASRTEVSVGDYQRFLRNPLVRLKLYAHPNQPRKHDDTPLNWSSQLQHPERPVVGVDWWSAYAYANWSGGKLPSADEWMHSVIGTEANLYPWGPEYREGYANDGTRKNLYPTQVRSGERSLHGLLHSGANVSEWTQDQVLNAQGRAMMVVVGGNFKLPARATQVDSSHLAGPSTRSEVRGFRVFFARPPLRIAPVIEKIQALIGT